jgi:hypothetical protein
MGHKADDRYAQFFAPKNFTRSTAIVRSIEGACAMPHSFPRSKHLNISYERAFGAHAANQEIDVATQHNICAANRTQWNTENFCAANQERENQTMVPRSPTFRRDSF